MITTFTPVSDSFAVAGTSDSQIQIIQFPNTDTSWLDVQFESQDSNENPVISSQVTRPSSTTSLGKCSFWAVNDIAHCGEIVAAVSGSSLSFWDLVKNCRVRHSATPDHATACKYVGPQLLAVAGHGRSVHLYDMRVRSSAQSPAWTAKVATDNLYTIAVDEGTVYAGGADGCIYGVDLRAQEKCRWDLQPSAQVHANAQQSALSPSHRSYSGERSKTDAILDVKVSGNELVLTLESGHVCGVPRQLPAKSEVTNHKETHQKYVRHGDFLFYKTYSDCPVSTRIGCDVMSFGDFLHLTVGSEHGVATQYKYDRVRNDLSIIGEVKVGGKDMLVGCVHWTPRGLFASSGESLSLFPFS